MGKWIHKLSEVDRDAKTAFCAFCGPVKINIRSTGVARCANKKKTDNRKSWAQVTYGLTPDEFNTMLIEQSGRCGICETPMRSPHIDHNHKTGAVRALLCRSCNHMLGNAQDDPEIFKAAISYLEDHRP